MAEALKAMYNKEFLRGFSEKVHAVYDGFAIENFITATMDESWDGLELKARMRRVKARGHTSRKSFLLSDKTVSGGTRLNGTRTHNWSNLTTAAIILASTGLYCCGTGAKLLMWD